MTRIAPRWTDEAAGAQMRFPQADAARKLDRAQARSEFDRLIGAGVVAVFCLAFVMAIAFAAIAVWWLI